MRLHASPCTLCPPPPAAPRMAGRPVKTSGCRPLPAPLPAPAHPPVVLTPPPGQAEADLRAAGKSEEEIEKFKTLFCETRTQIDSKQLRPFIRTQYMRTAFQVRWAEGGAGSGGRTGCSVRGGVYL